MNPNNISKSNIINPFKPSKYLTRSKSCDLTHKYDLFNTNSNTLFNIHTYNNSISHKKDINNQINHSNPKIEFKINYISIKNLFVRHCRCLHHLNSQPVVVKFYPFTYVYEKASKIKISMLDSLKKVKELKGFKGLINFLKFFNKNKIKISPVENLQKINKHVNKQNISLT